MLKQGRCNMLKEFVEIRKKLEQYDSKREELIKRSRDLLKISKQVIYSMHRGNKKEASEQVDKAHKIKKALPSLEDFAGEKLILEEPKKKRKEDMKEERLKSEEEKIEQKFKRIAQEEGAGAEEGV